MIKNFHAFVKKKNKNKNKYNHDKKHHAYNIENNFIFKKLLNSNNFNFEK